MSANERIPAGKLYQGRAFREAELAARALSAEIYILSAGLGLVSQLDDVPAYSLTVANGADNILARLDPPHDKPRPFGGENFRARPTRRPSSTYSSKRRAWCSSPPAVPTFT